MSSDNMYLKQWVEYRNSVLSFVPPYIHPKVKEVVDFLNTFHHTVYYGGAVVGSLLDLESHDVDIGILGGEAALLGKLEKFCNEKGYLYNRSSGQDYRNTDIYTPRLNISIEMLEKFVVTEEFAERMKKRRKFYPGSTLQDTVQFDLDVVVQPERTPLELASAMDVDVARVAYDPVAGKYVFNSDFVSFLAHGEPGRVQEANSHKKYIRADRIERYYSRIANSQIRHNFFDQYWRSHQLGKPRVIARTVIEKGPAEMAAEAEKLRKTYTLYSTTTSSATNWVNNVMGDMVYVNVAPGVQQAYYAPIVDNEENN